MPSQPQIVYMPVTPKRYSEKCSYCGGTYRDGDEALTAFHLERHFEDGKDFIIDVCVSCWKKVFDHVLGEPKEKTDVL